MDVHIGTISRRMRGVTPPPWRSVTYHAETGSRCPAAPEHDLRDYIGRCYRSRAAKEGLRAALAETLAELPQVDREDVLAYCGDGDLARLWAVLQWHALCCDYAGRYSDCVMNRDDERATSPLTVFRAANNRIYETTLMLIDIICSPLYNMEAAMQLLIAFLKYTFQLIAELWSDTR